MSKQDDLLDAMKAEAVAIHSAKPATLHTSTWSSVEGYRISCSVRGRGPRAAGNKFETKYLLDGEAISAKKLRAMIAAAEVSA